MSTTPSRAFLLVALSACAGPPAVPVEPNGSESMPVGRLPPAEIQRVVRSQFDRLRKCYEQELKLDPVLEGKVSTRFVIDRNGKVPEARTTVSGRLPLWMGHCVESVFRSLQFDQPDGGIVTVTYPIMFSPGR